MKLGPFPTNVPWGSSAIQAWLDRLRQMYNTWQPEYTVVAGSGIYVSYNHIAKTITISTSPILTVSLDFSSADNSQYLALISVGGM